MFLTRIPHDLYNQILTFLNPYDHFQLTRAGWHVKQRTHLKDYWFQQLTFDIDLLHRTILKRILYTGQLWYDRIIFTFNIISDMSTEFKIDSEYLLTYTVYETKVIYHFIESNFYREIHTGFIRINDLFSQLAEGPVNLNLVRFTPNQLREIASIAHTIYGHSQSIAIRLV